MQSLVFLVRFLQKLSKKNQGGRLDPPGKRRVNTENDNLAKLFIVMTISPG